MYKPALKTFESWCLLLENYEFPYLHKERKFIPLFRKFKAEGKSEDDMVELYNLMIQKRNTLQAENIDLTKCNSYDEVYSILQNMSNVEKSNKFIKLLPNHLRDEIKHNQQNRTKFQELVSEYDYDDYKNNFLKKVAKYKTVEEFLQGLNDHISSISSEAKDVYDKIRSLSPGIKLVHGEPKLIIAEVFDYKTMSQIGSQQWCIATQEYQWRSYVDNKIGRQYIIWDFNYPSTDPRSLIGVTLYQDNRGTVAHLRNDNSDVEYVKKQEWFKYLKPVDEEFIKQLPASRVLQLVHNGVLSIDKFTKEELKRLIIAEPGLFNYIKKDQFNMQEIMSLIDQNPDVNRFINAQTRLDIIKYRKSIENPERRQMEEENQLYIFIARPKFVEQKNGTYIKTLEIENLVPIDPYDASYAGMMSMMRLRARVQGENSEVYGVWLPHDFLPDSFDVNNYKKSKHIIDLIDKYKFRVAGRTDLEKEFNFNIPNR